MRPQHERYCVGLWGMVRVYMRDAVLVLLAMDGMATPLIIK